MPLKTFLNSLCNTSDSQPRISSPSAAQRCPEDILRIIYYGASSSECARGARVCLAWYDACTVELYRTFPYSFLYINCNRTKEIRWLSSSGALRARLGSLVINMLPQPYYAPMSSILTPLAPIFTTKSKKSARPSYLRIEGNWHIGRAPRMIAKSGLIRNIRHLDLRSNGADFGTYHHTFTNYKAAFRTILPVASSLVSFSAELETRVAKRIAYHGLPSPLRPLPLRRLSLHIYVLGREVLPLLWAVTDTLQQLHLSITFVSDEIEMNPCIKAISKMRGLVELMMEVESSASPILDDIVPHLPNLRYLLCGRNTFSAALFNHLPTTLQGLYLVGPLPWRLHKTYPTVTVSARDYRATPYDIMRQLLDSEQSRIRLKSLYWRIDDPGAGKQGAVGELENMAREAGVYFQSRESYTSWGPWGREFLEYFFSLESKMAPKPRA